MTLDNLKKLGSTAELSREKAEQAMSRLNPVSFQVGKIAQAFAEVYNELNDYERSCLQGGGLLDYCPEGCEGDCNECKTK